MSKIKFGDFAINLTEKKKPTPDEQLLYIGLEHLDSNCLHVTRWGSEVPIKGEKLVMHKGDILLGKRNAYLRRAAIAPHDGVFSAHGMVLRPKEGIIDSNFFPIFIGSDYFFDAAIKISVGSLSPTINWKDLKELEFNIPDLPEQKKIATLFWALDRTKEGYKRLLTITDELVKSRFIEMFGDPLSNPKGWDKATVGEVCYYIKDGPHKSLQDLGEGHGRPFISVRNIVNGRIDFSTAKYISDSDYAEAIKKCHPEKGDILYSKGGTTGIAKLIDIDVEFANWVHVAVLKFNKNMLNGVFFENMLNSDYCYTQSQRLTKGIANRDLVLSAMAKIQLFVPPLDLQNLFADFVAQVDKSKLALQESLDKLEKLQKALIKKYLG